MDMVEGEEGPGLYRPMTGGAILHQYRVSEWVGFLRNIVIKMLVMEREREEKREGG